MLVKKFNDGEKVIVKNEKIIELLRKGEVEGNMIKVVGYGKYCLIDENSSVVYVDDDVELLLEKIDKGDVECNIDDVNDDGEDWYKELYE